MMSFNNVRAVLVKAESEWGEVGRNFSLFEKIADKLVELKPDLIITPECFLDGYMERDKERRSREAIAQCAVVGADDPILVQVAGIAKRLNSYIVFGATEARPNGSLQNAAYLFGRKGEHIGTYYKVQTSYYDPGDELPVFEADFGKLGIVICADRRWPENIRCLRLKGADLIANPTWGFHGEMNTAIMRTRAYENGIPICFAHPHESLICAADGSISAFLQSNVPDVLVHDIDLTRNVSMTSDPDKEVADSEPIQQRRPELYHALVEER